MPARFEASRSRDRWNERRFELIRWAGKCLTIVAAAIIFALAQNPVAAAQDSAASRSTISRPRRNHHRKAGKSLHTETAASKKSNGDSLAENPMFASNHGPIKITSDTMSLDYKNKSVLFNGHVHAIQAGSQLTSDSLTVQYGDNFKDVKDITANGDVRMTQGTRYATSDHAVMNQNEQTVVLTGHPVVHDGMDQITGKKITVYIKTGKSVVEEAQAVLFPRGSKTPDNGINDGKASPAGKSGAVAPAASLP